MSANKAVAREDRAEEIFEDNRYFEEQKYGTHRAAMSPEVLVAEDDDDMRSLVASALREDGFGVVEARTGTELRGLIGSRRRGRGAGPLGLIIVTDVRMQGATGLEVLAELREHDWSTPIVLMTAFGDAKLHAMAERLGALAVFDKPFDIRELRKLVRPWAQL